MCRGLGLSSLMGGKLACLSHFLTLWKTLEVASYPLLATRRERVEYWVQVIVLEQPHLWLLLCALREAPGHRSFQLLWENKGLPEHASTHLPVFGGRFRVLQTTAVGTTLEQR